MTKRRRFSADFKARVALEALRGDKTIQEIAVKHKVHPNQVGSGRRWTAWVRIFQCVARSAWTTSRSSTISMPRLASSRWNGIFWPEGSSDEPGGPQGDNRARPPRSELEPSMPSAVDRPIVGLLRSQGREPGQPGADAAHRRVVPEVSVLRLPSDGAAVTARRHSRRPSPSSPAHAVDGSSGHLSAAEDQRATPGASDLSLPSQEADNRPAQPGLAPTSPTFR